MPTLSPLSLWLALAHTPGLPRKVARLTLQWAGLPPPPLDEHASCEPWMAKLSQAPWGALVRDALKPACLAGDAGLVRRWLEADPGHALLTPAHPAWPALLAASPEPPVLLYAHGSLSLLQRPAIAIVGTRRPTAQGRETARRLASCASAHGFCVVSGMATGIDACAHEAALGLPGSSIAVLGTGIDQCYPAAHRGLSQRLTEQGLRLSEWPLGAPAAKHHFPWRNRIVAGLAQATLVVEAASRSGSLLTASLALDMGRDVLAVPGSIYSEQSQGCLELIQQGAGLIQHEAALLAALQWQGHEAAVSGAGVGLHGRPQEELGARAGWSGSIKPQAARLPDPPPGTTPPTGTAPAVTDAPVAPSQIPLAPPRPPADGPEAAPAFAQTQPLVRSAGLLDWQELGWDPFSLDQAQISTGLTPGVLLTALLDAELAGEVARLPGGRWQRCP